MRKGDICLYLEDNDYYKVDVVSGEKVWISNLFDSKIVSSEDIDIVSSPEYVDNSIYNLRVVLIDNYKYGISSMSEIATVFKDGVVLFETLGDYDGDIDLIEHICNICNIEIKDSISGGTYMYRKINNELSIKFPYSPEMTLADLETAMSCLLFDFKVNIECIEV